MAMGVWALVLIGAICTSQISAQFDYAKVLEKSLLFYEAQRSGKLPENNRIPWRWDSAVDDAVVGGYYDDAYHGKFTFPTAAATTVLLWGLIEFREGYTQAGQLDNMLDNARWSLDFLLAAHTAKEEMVAQIGLTKDVRSYWGRPEDLQGERPSFKIDTSNPGADLAGEAAAALAAGYMVFSESDREYADTLLRHARELYEFADKYRGKFSDNIPDSQSDYQSNRYDDELAWGAVWLYRATKEEAYFLKAEELYTRCCSWRPWAFDWNDKQAGVQILLFILEERPPVKAKYLTDMVTYLDGWLPEGGAVDYTPKGLAWRQDWGSLRYTANQAFLSLVAAKYEIFPDEYKEFAKLQMGYLLGSTGQSFVVGFNVNYPLYPHHAASSCPEYPWPCDWSAYDSPLPNPFILEGALVGGPDKNDVYHDDRKDSLDNKVSIDFNAGFQSALAGMLALKV